jgi:hypothetical protein
MHWRVRDDRAQETNTLLGCSDRQTDLQLFEPNVLSYPRRADLEAAIGPIGYTSTVGFTVRGALCHSSASFHVRCGKRGHGTDLHPSCPL